MKYVLRILFVSVGIACLLSACKKETSTPSVINTELNLRYSEGDYVPTDADGWLTASMKSHSIYILTPPDTTPFLLADTDSYVMARFKNQNYDRIYAGLLQHNNDSIAYNPLFGYMSAFTNSLPRNIFLSGSHWSIGGHSEANIAAFTYNTSQAIPTLNLPTLSESYRKSDGMLINLNSTINNCNRLVLTIGLGDTLLFHKEIDTSSTTIFISPTELQNLPIDQSYDLTLKAKHYTSAVFSNKKIYFQNEVMRVHYFVLK